jgi:hypothetical protein
VSCCCARLPVRATGACCLRHREGRDLPTHSGDGVRLRRQRPTHFAQRRRRETARGSEVRRAFSGNGGATVSESTT